MYAIIEDSGTQIRVSEGDVIRVDARELPESTGDAPTLQFDRVLMVGGDGQPKIGQPYLEGASVAAQVVDADASEKYEIIKYRRRKHYRLRKGHRQHFIQVRVTGINA